MLILAQLLKRNAPVFKGLPEDPPGKAQYAQSIWESIIEDHFAREEEHLYPVLLEVAELQDLALELVNEHATLRRQYEGVVANPAAVEIQDTLGHMLEAHVRREERELFEAAQQALAPEVLVALAEVLAG